MDGPTLTKTDFILYRQCPKALWLKKNKRRCYPEEKLNLFIEKIRQEGYEVEEYVQRLFKGGVSLPEDTQTGLVRTKEEVEKGTALLFQPTFRAASGAFARADVLERNADGTYNLYEAKSSTKVKREKLRDHVRDACFQKIVLNDCGVAVRDVYIVHLNKTFSLKDKVRPEQLLTKEKVTDRVAEIEEETRTDIRNAISLIKEKKIDEDGCGCYRSTRANHCDTFEHFNGACEPQSVWELANLREKRLNTLLERGIKRVCDVPEDVELSDAQVMQVRSAVENRPIIDVQEMRNLLAEYEFPLHFLDYETVQKAVPVLAGTSPWYQIPVQFSLHVLDEDGNLTHAEYISGKYDQVKDFARALQQSIGKKGSIVSWNKQFEMGRNRDIARLYPEYRECMEGINGRMVDLMDIFKKTYIDRKFCGSASIKKVLPVLCPALSYEDLAIQEGGQAMSEWEIMAYQTDEPEKKEKIKHSLLEYCKLDTLAMVEIYKKVRRVASSSA